MRVTSLFSGIGGFELGLKRAQFEPALICDNDPAAAAVLKHRFPGITYRRDVTDLRSIPTCELLVAGWPCQDLSQAGRMSGIDGHRSTLINEVFRLLSSKRARPRFVVLENVAFSLHLQSGKAIRHVTDNLESLGYRWTYRILDSREFGVPQRRRRIFLVGCLDADPTPILFDGAGARAGYPTPKLVGFYWTEGNRGIGWTPEAIPPLKGGSGLSIPSPPAIWDRIQHTFFCPGIVDAERLQGFPANWTLPVVEENIAERVRWKLVGNAVSVPIAQWIGGRIRKFANGALKPVELPFHSKVRRSNFAFGGPGTAPQFAHLEVEGPANPRNAIISQFSFRDSKPLSMRAAVGFLSRLVESPLRAEDRFVSDLARYCGRLDLIADRAA